MPPTRDLHALLEQTSWIQALARSLVGEGAAADDLVQETWLLALRQRPDTERPLRGWLATVMRNQLRKLRRGETHRRAREQGVSRAEAQPSTLDVVERVSTHKDVVLAVLDLDEPYRTTLLMRYFEELSYDEIARHLGVARATVNSRITRGLEQLRHRLENEYGDRTSMQRALAPLAFASGFARSSQGAGSATGMGETGGAGGVPAWPAKAVVWGGVVLVVGLVPVLVRTFVQDGERAMPPPALAKTEEATTLRASLEEIDAPLREPVAEPVQVEPPEVTVTPTDVREQVVAKELVLGPSIERIELWLDRGDYEVRTSRSDTMLVELTVGFEPGDRRMLLWEDCLDVTDYVQRLELRSSNELGAAWIESVVVHMPRGVGFAGDTDSGDVAIRHGEGVVSANTGSGNVSCRIGGTPLEQMRLNTGSGRVEIEVGAVHGQGLFEANSGSGSVMARFLEPETPLEVALSTASGDVLVEVPADVVGRFQLRGDPGRLEIDSRLPMELEPLTTEGSQATQRARAGDEGGRFVLRSGHGDVVLRARGDGDLEEGR